MIRIGASSWATKNNELLVNPADTGPFLPPWSVVVSVLPWSGKAVFRAPIWISQRTVLSRRAFPIVALRGHLADRVFGSSGDPIAKQIARDIRTCDMEEPLHKRPDFYYLAEDGFMETVNKRPFYRLRAEVVSGRRHSLSYAAYSFWFPWMAGGKPLLTVEKQLHYMMRPLTIESLAFASWAPSGEPSPVLDILKHALLGKDI